MNYLDEMTAAYLECAKWAEEPDEQPARARWQYSTFTQAAKKQARLDCMKFLRSVAASTIETIEDCDPSQVGHDLWLSRNGHGAGFFDGNRDQYAPEHRNILQDLARAMGECYIFESRKRFHLEGGR